MKKNMSVCVNCEKARVYVANQLIKNQVCGKKHYVRCLAGKWERHINVYSESLRRERNCADYVSMGDDLDDYLASLPIDLQDYNYCWRI